MYEFCNGLAFFIVNLLNKNTIFVCLFKLALRPSQRLRSCRDVRSIYGTFTQNENVIAFNKCLKYGHPTKPQKACTYEWFDLNHFSCADQ